MRRDGQMFSQLRTRKVAALAVYLVYNQKPQSREHLADLLWDKGTPEKLQTSLRVALHDLRRNLDPFFEINRQNVFLKEQASVWLDARHLLEQLERGRAEVTRLRAALASYEGEFLAGFFVREASQFELWATNEREYIHQRVLDGHRTLAQHDLQHHVFEDGIRSVRRWLKLDPLAEDAYRYLMQMLAAQGQQAEALAQFEALQQVLEAELGLEPDPESASLVAQIAAGQWSPAPAEVRRTAVLHNLPADLTPFIGRQRELASLELLLSDRDVRLVTVCGPGGIGKTRLALAAARRQIDLNTLPDGVVFVPVADLTTATQMPGAIAAAAGLVLAPGSDQESQLERYLRHRRLLLLLDNLEQVAGADTYLAGLMRAAPWLTFLVTSRERLWLQAEHVMNLSGLPFESTPGDLPAAHDAGRFFLAAARRARYDFEAGAADRVVVDAICRLVEGMPLALELATGRVDTVSPGEIHQEISRSYLFLETRISDIPPRQRSMEAIFDSTWKQLSRHEQQLLATLAVFRGGATPAALIAITGAAADDLSALVSRNLLRYETQAERYDMHELLRQFAGQKLEATPEIAEAARSQHARYYGNLLAERYAALSGPAQEAVLNGLQLESGNLREAWFYALTQRNERLLQEACDTLGIFLLWRNHYRDGLEIFRTAAQVLEADAAADRLLRASVLTWHGAFAAMLQQKGAAEASLLRALALLAEVEPLSDRVSWQEGRTLLFLGQFLWSEGRYDEAEAAYERAITCFEKTADSWNLAAALAGMGNIANSRADYAEALQFFELSLARYRTLGDQRSLAFVLQRMSYAARDLGRIATAEAYAREALSLVEAIQDREQIAAAYLALGWLLLYNGRWAEALAATEQSAAIYQDLGLPQPLSVLGIITQEMGRYDESKQWLENHVAACRARNDPVELALGLNALSAAEVVARRYQEAWELQEESFQILDGSAQRDRLGQVYALRGYAERGLGNPEQAAEAFRTAVQISLDNRSIIPLLFGVPDIALILAEEGRTVEALRLYAPLGRMPLVANSALRADLSGKELAQLAGVTIEQLGRLADGADWSPWEAAEEALRALSRV